MRDYAFGKINLSKVFAESIHLPLRREDTGVYPLYQHKYGSETARRTQRSNAWHTECKSNINSPSNIRLVCLDQSEAFVSYWSPPIIRGRQHEVANPLYEKYVDGGLRVLLDPYTLTSDSAGLGCICSNYVCRNIEELWVSAELFGVAGNNNAEYADFYRRLCTLKPGQAVSADELLKYLEFETNRSVRDTFPLLRSIVVVVRPPELRHIRFYEYAQRTEIITTYLNETYPNERKAIGEVPELVQRIASKAGFGLAVCAVPGADMLKFSLGDYRYDDEVLSVVKGKIDVKYSKKEVEPVSESSVNRALFK